MIKKISYKNGNHCTTITIKHNFVKKYIISKIKKNEKFFCIVDIRVKRALKGVLNKDNLNCIFISSGERIKNIDTYNEICEKLLSKNIDRKSLIIAIGGGTLGDLVGFVASTILRGVRLTYIPTTLLSQVDSSIGGKNGINTKNGKNLIGVFYQPQEVIIDTNFLKTLPLREIKSGYAEIIKHALIKDYNFFKWLDNRYDKIFELNIKILEETIYKSILIKLWYVQKDPNENLIDKNSRAMLNFGHSFGHALETFYNYSKKLNHGEAISIGMFVEASFSYYLGYLTKYELNLILDHFKKVKLKTFDKNIYNKKIIEIIQKDKKNHNNRVNIVLLKKIGECFFKRNINNNLLKKFIKEL